MNPLIASSRAFLAAARGASHMWSASTEKVEARFDKGVLKITLPKKPEAQKTEKKIEIKTG